VRPPGRLVLLGHPVRQSLSPRFQGAALRAAGLAVKYTALDVAPSDFDPTLALLRTERAGGNVTAPHKQRMFAACDSLSALARRVGAVNTFWIDDDGRLVGENTDVGGFNALATEAFGAPLRDITVGVLGAGGAAAAVLAAVEGWPGCNAHVFNRTPERARLLCERFRAVARPVDDVGAIAGAHLVVNATSIGLKDETYPVDPAIIPTGAVVIDLVYKPAETRFVQALRRAGVRAVDGKGMLIEQGALAFEQWFGLTPDRAVMWRALDQAEPPTP
jgi:shikimate dehydrogenase